MSKAARIRELYAKGKTCGEIAQIVGCRVEYARVCAQQRRGEGGRSQSDERYYAKSENRDRRRTWCRNYTRNRYQNDPEFRARHQATRARYEARKRQEAMA